MADVQRTIIAGGGGDYTTITAWEAATNLGGGSDIWHGIISDDSNYNEAVTINTDGTSTSSYVWLDVDPSNRHAGVAGTGHARMVYSGGGNEVLLLDADYARVSWLEIELNSTTASQEAFRVGTNTTNVLISYCIAHGDGVSDDQDGLYMDDTPNNVASVSIDNCLFYGFARAGIHPQYYSTSGGGTTTTVNVDHCAFDACGESGEPEAGGIYVRTSEASDTVVINLYNSWAARTIGQTSGNQSRTWGDGSTTPGGPGGGASVTWNGGWLINDDSYDNIDGTNNLSNFATAGDGIDDEAKGSGNWILVQSIVAGSEDYQPRDDSGSDILDAGTNRQGSEPDARQDFSVDLAGNSRPTTGITLGPFQLTAASTDATIDGSPALAGAFGPAATPTTTSNAAAAPQPALAGAFAPAATASAETSTTVATQAAIAGAFAPAATAATLTSTALDTQPALTGAWAPAATIDAAANISIDTQGGLAGAWAPAADLASSVGIDSQGAVAGAFAPTASVDAAQHADIAALGALAGGFAPAAATDTSGDVTIDAQGALGGAFAPAASAAVDEDATVASQGAWGSAFSIGGEVTAVTRVAARPTFGGAFAPAATITTPSPDAVVDAQPAWGGGFVPRGSVASDFTLSGVYALGGAFAPAATISAAAGTSANIATQPGVAGAFTPTSATTTTATAIVATQPALAGAFSIGAVRSLPVVFGAGLGRSREEDRLGRSREVSSVGSST